MHFRQILAKSILIGSAVFLVVGCNDNNNASSTASAVTSTPLQPIVIQGALPIESEHLASKLSNVSTETIGGWKFWKGSYAGYPIIISKTRMGMTNSAAATAIAIERYKPIAIINQGTSGGHDPNLHVFDIVLGKYATNIGAFKTPTLPLGGGSDSLEWTDAFDVLPDDEADPVPIGIRKFEANAELLAAANKVKGSYSKGNVVEGTIGSADVWNSELDRIKFFHDNYGTSVEEMEAASVAQVAAQYKVPFLGIRVLSNNITNGGSYDPAAGDACQEYVLEVVKAYMQAQAAKAGK